MTSDVGFEAYMPGIDEVPPERARLIRTLLEQHAKAAAPDLACGPNTPFGDLFLSPAALALAAAEIAAERFASDLDLENVANGIIYSCPFVNRYLYNFVGGDDSPEFSFSTVRLEFSDPNPREIDRGLIIKLSDGVLFRPFLPADGPLYLTPLSLTAPAGSNSVRLLPYGSYSYTADVPVYGPSTTAEAGSPVELDRILTGLTGATLLAAPPAAGAISGITARARRARQLHHAVSPSSREGLRSLVLGTISSCLSASPIFPGDNEMVRDAAAGIGSKGYAVDVRVAGKIRIKDRRLFRIRYDGTSFAGEFHPPEGAVAILFARPEGWPENEPNPAFKIYARSNGPLMFSAAGTGKERFWLKANRPTLNTTPLPLHIDPATGTEYAVWEIEFLVDPCVKPIRDLLLSPDYTAPGIDVLVAPAHHVIINSMVVRYRRKKGTRVDLETARKEIAQFMTTCAHPDVFSEGKISEIMHYHGASAYQGLTLVSKLHWGLADYHVPASNPNPDGVGGWSAFVNGAVAAPVLEPVSGSALEISYRDPIWGGPGSSYAAAGPRTVCYWLEEKDIFFKEE